MFVFSERQLAIYSLVVLFLGLAIGFAIGSFSTAELISYESLPAGSFSAEIKLAAVTAEGEGMLSLAEVEVKDGKGRVLFAMNPFVEPDTQLSAETAALVAQKFAHKSLKNKDVIYSIKAENVQLVGGPSAGAALTAATIAAILHKNIRKDVIITGTINKDGSIGKVGGILEKAQAAAKAGIKIFLVPKGQGKITIYEKKVEEKRGPGFIFQTIEYVPKEVDLNKLMYEQHKMQVIEVSNIKEALKYILTS